jgi:energy-coupling factor transporter transmembrane protein EcfT
MNPIRETSLVVRNAALVTVAVIFGFCVGSALGLPVWLQGLFLIPAMILFYALSGEQRPAFWKIFGFTGLLSVFVLLVSWGFRYVPEQYFWIYFILIAFVPFGPILNWFERRFKPKRDKSQQAGPSNGG